MSGNSGYQRAFRDRGRGGPPRVVTACPSWQAATRHRVSGDVCADPVGCVEALRLYNREAARRSRAKRAGEKQ